MPIHCINIEIRKLRKLDIIFRSVIPYIHPLLIQSRIRFISPFLLLSRSLSFSFFFPPLLHLRENFDSLAFHHLSDVEVKKVAVENSLDNAGEDGDWVVVVLVSKVTVDPVDNVEGTFVFYGGGMFQRHYGVGKWF